MIIPLLCVVLFFVILLFRKRKLTLLKRCNIPGPEPNFIFGNLRQYCAMGNIGFHTYLIEKYGSIVGYYLGTVPYVLVADQELLQRIQVTDAKRFLLRPRRIPGGINPDPRRRNMLGHLPVEDWANIRKVLSPGFSPAKVKNLLNEIQGCIETLLEKVDEKLQNEESDEIDLAEFYQNFSLDIILETAFGYPLDVQHRVAHPLLNAVQAKFENPTFSWWIWASVCFPEFFLLIQPFRTGLAKLSDHFGFKEAYVWQVAREAIDNRLKNPSDALDELQILLNGNISHDQIAAYGVHAMQGGIMIRNVITQLLAQHQNVQNKVVDEILAYGATKQRDYYQFLSELRYLNCVINESLRLWPQTTFIRRSPCETYEFTKNGVTYTLPKGIHVQVAHYQIHHSDENWPDSDRFYPERFLDEYPVNMSLNNPRWQAFGCGARHCMGYRLALMVLKATVVSVVEKYAFLPFSDRQAISSRFKTHTVTMDPKEPVLVKLMKR